MKIIKLLAVLGVCAMAANQVYADTETVDSEAEFRQAVSLVKNTDIDFTTGSGVIEFTGAPTGADLIQLGSNGNIGTAGTVFTAPATGVVGDVDINGDGTSAVDISCTATATLSDGVNTIAMNQVALSLNTGRAFGSEDYTCAGVGTTPHSYTLTGADKILMGGHIDGGSVVGTLGAGVYNTSNVGGSNITVDVVYQ